ncbi:MAG: DUF5995 family protein [Saprospiraceae bacterium]
MPTPLPSSIDDVIKRLDLIIQETVEANNFLGIFAYVYRRTTAQIQKSIIEKRFEDNERMEKFDVIFANRYIEAYENFKSQKPISKSWMSAFKVKDQPFTIIQHLMMGMNAHISFDLGIAAAEIAPGEKIDALENDFMLVNQTLQEIISEMQDRISKVSRLMFLLDWVGKEKDEKAINFGIVKSRQFAWEVANGIATLEFNENAKNVLIEKTDNTVAALNILIQRPPSKILNFALRVVSFFEEKNIGKIIKQLQITT